ncbi:uncharacterized protein TRAVEDRAFT_121078, partial [Trametes versicolor FP-101664 SS1]|uniref:uncharacterized protein n=1 Tax=Trametes versicolor (strain FP-101664) TaxID=717944 RepID=UPI000462146B
NTWHIAYNCSIKEEVMLRVIPEVLPADNPQQSASCSHVGLHGNHPCRHCEFGGLELERETDEGYESHFSVTGDTTRTAAETLAAVCAQLHAAGLGVAKTVTDMQTMSGIKDPLAAFWVQQLIVPAHEKQQIRIHNPTTRDPRLNVQRMLNSCSLTRGHWRLVEYSGLDVHRDTPMELLHTYLLGIKKYSWYHIHNPWTASQHEAFATQHSQPV